VKPTVTPPRAASPDTFDTEPEEETNDFDHPSSQSPELTDDEDFFITEQSEQQELVSESDIESLTGLFPGSVDEDWSWITGLPFYASATQPVGF